MSRKGRSLSITQPAARPGSATISGQVVRGEDETRITWDLKDLRRVDRTMPIECGRAVVRLDSPELQLAQFAPFAPGRIIRLLIARYERERFKARAEANEQFRGELEQFLSRGDRGKPGYYAAQFDEGELDSDAGSALLDAEAEAMTFVGGKGSIVFLVSSNLELHYAVRGLASTVAMSPEIEVTMPARVLADLLLSWKQLAEKL